MENVLGAYGFHPVPPEPTFVPWHVREVFQREARYSRNLA